MDETTRIQRMVVDLEAGVRRMDPGAQLTVCRLLTSITDDLQTQAVLQARARGYTWETIGSLLGVTRQSVWIRYAKVCGEGAEHAPAGSA